MREFPALWRVAAALILTAVAVRSPASESEGVRSEKPVAGIVVFAALGSNSLEVVSPDGTPAPIKIAGARAIQKIRATPGEKAILLVADDKRVQSFVEIDAQGGRTWELPLTSVSENETLVSYEPLAAEGLLACFRRHALPRKPERGQRIVQIDRSGKIVREKKLDPENPSLHAVHWIDENRVLVVETDRVYEMDWTGKEQFVLPLAKGPTYADCIRMPEGTYIVAANTKRETKQKTGWIAELAPDGREVWKVAHECPAALHPSADFKAVILEAG